MFSLYLYRQCPAGSVPYTIRSGDTLNRIAQEYSTTVQEIINANPIIDPNSLRIGQQICVPISMQIYPSCPTTNYYVVVSEDTLESIAEYFDITPQLLLYANYGIDPNDLYVDQVLCIPVAPPPVSINVDVGNRSLVVYRDGNEFRRYNIANENPAFPIPQGTFTVLNKQVDPGVDFGARWIGLSEAGFGIHGINTPEFINILATENNIIMSNQDISELFNLVPVGTVIDIS